jgi:ABC-type phosphate transport system ATPase subunit
VRARWISARIAITGAYTVVIVTHDIEEARRVSDYTAYLRAERVVEFGGCRAERRDARITERPSAGRTLL